MILGATVPGLVVTVHSTSALTRMICSAWSIALRWAEKPTSRVVRWLPVARVGADLQFI
jgi:hypothetical protein